MGRILVVGIGPGEGYLTPRAEEAIERAEAFVGGKRALDLAPGGEKLAITGHLEEIEKFIRERETSTIAVLTTGDPGLYSILRFLLSRFDPQEIEVIPGVSSVQLCFSRLRDTWEGAKIISLHGRSGEVEREVEENKKVAILTDESSPPQAVAKSLLQALNRNLRAGVCSHLEREGEKVFISHLRDITTRKFPGNSVMVVWNE